MQRIASARFCWAMPDVADGFDERVGAQSLVMRGYRPIWWSAASRWPRKITR
ncbi:hypothetical protein XMIN_4072 [Xanthomonas citri pv. mangiferaeindicae LMG 941]|nr:hypothetical protein XMIN_4072 [Xanthomonas citri pv. mangiferaeindicae LMG 941]